MNAIDYGVFAPFIAVVAVAFVGVAVVVGWLDNRRAKDQVGTAQRIADLEARISHLENGHALAQGLILEAITLLPGKDSDAIGKKLIEACRVLA